MARSLARCSAMQMIYEAMMGGAGGEDTLCGLLHLNPNEDDTHYINEMLSGVRTHTAELDAIITRFAKDWSLDRMARVDLAILRLALYEMMFCPSVPVPVSISEACELADTYSAADSKRFINGILGAVARSGEVPS